MRSPRASSAPRGFFGDVLARRAVLDMRRIEASKLHLQYSARRILRPGVPVPSRAAPPHIGAGTCAGPLVGSCAYPAWQSSRPRKPPPPRPTPRQQSHVVIPPPNPRKQNTTRQPHPGSRERQISMRGICTTPTPSLPASLPWVKIEICGFRSCQVRVVAFPAGGDSSWG